MSSDLAYMRVNLLVIVYQNFIANVKHFPLTFIMVFAIISLGKINGRVNVCNTSPALAERKASRRRSELEEEI